MCIEISSAHVTAMRKIAGGVVTTASSCADLVNKAAAAAPAAKASPVRAVTCSAPAIRSASRKPTNIQAMAAAAPTSGRSSARLLPGGGTRRRCDDGKLLIVAEPPRAAAPAARASMAHGRPAARSGATSSGLAIVTRSGADSIRTDSSTGWGESSTASVTPSVFSFLALTRTRLSSEPTARL
jgi:hypothetical protein